jgi:hypothetical protein
MNEKDCQECFFDREAYRRRNVIERSVTELKEMRRIVKRHGKLNNMNENTICLGFIVVYLRSLSNRRFSDRAYCLSGQEGNGSKCPYAAIGMTRSPLLTTTFCLDRL